MRPGHTTWGSARLVGVILALAWTAGLTRADPEGSAVAQTVIEGCRVREDTTCGFEFTAVTERFTSRRLLAGMLMGDPDGPGTVNDPTRANEILTLTTLGDADGSRSKLIEHHRGTS